MTITITLSPQNEERLIEAARRTGIAPSDLAQRLVENNLPPAASQDTELGDFGGLTIGQLAADLIGSVNSKSDDGAKRRGVGHGGAQSAADIYAMAARIDGLGETATLKPGADSRQAIYGHRA